MTLDPHLAAGNVLARIKIYRLQSIYEIVLYKPFQRGRLTKKRKRVSYLLPV